MKNELTAKRIQLALSNANMKPQELADKSGVGKASISQYVNGSHAPGNISAEKIGKILNVNPLWLMGFDVDITESTIKEADISKDQPDSFSLSELEKNIIRKFRLLSNGERSMFLRTIGIDEKETDISRVG